jgi:hypothetical protein
MSAKYSYWVDSDSLNVKSITLNPSEVKEVVAWSKTYSYYDYMKDVDTYDKHTLHIKAEVGGFTIQTKDVGVSIHLIVKTYKPPATTTKIATLPVITSPTLKGEEGKIIYVDVPNQVYYDQPYTIIATAKNTGDKEGDIRIAITPYGSIEEKGQFTRLKPGETFTYSKEDVVFKGGVTSKTWVITASIRDPANPNFWKTTDSKTITINFVQKAIEVDYSEAEKNKAYLGIDRITITSNIPVEVLLDGKNVKSGDSIELPKTTHELIAPNKVEYNGIIYELKAIKLNGTFTIGYCSPVYSNSPGNYELVYEKSVANNITGGKTVDVSGSETKIAEVTSTKTTYKEEVKDGEIKQVLVDESSKEKVEMKPPEKKLEIPLINIVLFAVIGILFFGIIYLIIKMFKKGRIR